MEKALIGFNQIYYVAQYYSPEPYLKDSKFTNDLSELLDKDVQVVTGFPNYPKGHIYAGYKNSFRQKEKLGRSDIVRLLTFAYHGPSVIKRVLNYLVFSLSAAFYLLFNGQRNSVYIIQQSSPFVGFVGLVIRIFKPKSSIILDVQDVFPENIKASGFLKSNLAIRFIDFLVKRYYGLFDAFICVSDGVSETIKLRTADKKPVRTVFNWAISEGQEEPKESSFQLEKMEDRVNLVYAGNIGVHQGLESLVPSFLTIVDKQPIAFHFIGSGTSEEVLRSKLAGSPYIKFYGRVSPEEANMAMNQADALFLNLKDSSGYEHIIPSKLQGYFYADKPILAGVKGEARKILVNSKMGLAYNPGDVESFVGGVEEFVENFTKYKNNTGSNFYQNNFARSKGLTTIFNLIDELRVYKSK